MTREGKLSKSAEEAGKLIRDLSSDVVRKLTCVRALWLAVHNDPDRSVQDLSVEFFFAVGRLLEGESLEKLELRLISLKRAYPYLKEG